MLLDKDDPIRIRISLSKHTCMLVRPVLITLITLLLWYQIHWVGGIFFDASAVEAIAITAVILVIPFGLLATTAVSKAWEKQDRVVDALFAGDKRQFLRYRDERIRVGVHIILIVLASAIIALAAMIPFEKMWQGLAVMTVVTFSHVLIWEVIRLLEDPAESQWIASRAQAEWLSADVDQEFFGTKTQPE